MGISAHFIELHRKTKLQVKEHVIIEAHPEVCKYGKLMYSKEVKNKSVIFKKGFWQDVVKKLKKRSYDGILFDTYPLTEREIHKNHFSFFKVAHALLKKGGILTYYSDENSKFSKEHIEKLKEAGFNEIKWKVCKVNPPKGSMYWRRKTIIAPIIIK